ncbi:hypothetical protein [uncultured Mediterranean phage uvMED]|nr:hypothetical protein [uncultured Mediterranean phage uvMED]
MLQALLGPIGNIATTFLKNRAEKAKAKQKLAVAKIEATTKKVQSDANWEASAMDASKDSIKDELWTICFILLIIACFIPAAQPYIENGFKFLREDCPDWLSWGILASIGASFGLKSIGQFKK